MDTTERELDHRGGDGIEVRLLWKPDTNRVVVAVVDERESFRITVHASDALDAFRHPYAYDCHGYWTAIRRGRQ